LSHRQRSIYVQNGLCIGNGKYKDENDYDNNQPLYSTSWYHEPPFFAWVTRSDWLLCGYWDD
ncbi:MAG: hypothetical protein VST67_11850, partial [Nitrospirota bacterium]|nr:hypothetical protein [Nitrospirota bacterium]